MYKQGRRLYYRPMKNTLIGFLLALIFASFAAAAATPKPAWIKKEAAIETPESAYFDPASGYVYVSNVAGAPDGKDGKGWISRMKPDGKELKKGVDGFNAPKGLRAHQGTLWVSDIDRVMAIDVASAKIKSTIPIEGAKFLNDVATGEDGAVYVSDTFGNKIFVIRDGEASVFAEGEQLLGPNGLLVQGGTLVVAGMGLLNPDWSTKVPGKLYKINLKSKEQSAVTPELAGNLDGLESDGAEGYIVSDWMAGKVFRVSKGKVTELTKGYKGSADLGFVEKTRMMILPAMAENRVLGFKVAK